MKFHLHIPKLEQFALYVVCDGITRRGTAGLTRQMPYVLYLRCIMAFAEERYFSTDSRRIVCDITVISMYDIIKAQRCVTDDTWHLFLRTTLAASISALDHVALEVEDTDRPNLAFIISAILRQSDDDVDAVIQCLHRFTSRCVVLGKYEMMMDMITSALKRCPCKAIRQVLMQYGARLKLDGGVEYFGWMWYV